MNWSDNLLGEAEMRVEVFHGMGIHPGIHPLQDHVPQATQAPSLLPAKPRISSGDMSRNGPHRLTYLHA